MLEVHKAANCAILWSTYTCHLSGGEDAWQQEHLDRDSQDEDEGERQRRLGGHDGPQRRQTHQLDAGEQMHPQRTYLEGAKPIFIEEHFKPD